MEKYRNRISFSSKDKQKLTDFKINPIKMPIYDNIKIKQRPMIINNYQVFI